MPLTSSPERAEQELIGRALRVIREARQMRQADIAGPLGISTQAWQKYEAGERTFSDERLDQVLAILQATRADLEAERARILGKPGRTPGGPASFADRGPALVFDVFGRTRSGPRGVETYDLGEPLRSVDLRQVLGGQVEALQVAGDTMAPWAEPGEIVIFDRNAYPRRGAGCVVEMNSGEAFVRLYAGSDGSNLFVRELHPEERTTTIPLADVAGVYAVKFRGD